MSKNKENKESEQISLMDMEKMQYSVDPLYKDPYDFKEFNGKKTQITIENKTELQKLIGNMQFIKQKK